MTTAIVLSVFLFNGDVPGGPGHGGESKVFKVQRSNCNNIS